MHVCVITRSTLVLPILYACVCYNMEYTSTPYIALTNFFKWQTKPPPREVHHQESVSLFILTRNCRTLGPLIITGIH